MVSRQFALVFTLPHEVPESPPFSGEIGLVGNLARHLGCRDLRSGEVNPRFLPRRSHNGPIALTALLAPRESGVYAHVSFHTQEF